MRQAANTVVWDELVSYLTRGGARRPPHPLTPRLGDFEADYEDHSITVGLRWAFGAR